MYMCLSTLLIIPLELTALHKSQNVVSCTVSLLLMEMNSSIFIVAVNVVIVAMVAVCVINFPFAQTMISWFSQWVYMCGVCVRACVKLVCTCMLGYK